MFVRQYAVTIGLVLACNISLACQADAATCIGGKIAIVPSPLPSSAYHTFSNSQRGTRVYSYDLITVRSGKDAQTFIPSSTIVCDRTSIIISANGARHTYPLTAQVTSQSVHTWAVFPGLAPTAEQAAEIRLAQTRLVRTITAAEAAATPTPVPSASPSPKPKHLL